MGKKGEGLTRREFVLQVGLGVAGLAVASPAKLAIVTRDVDVVNRWGKPVRLNRPYVDPVLCNGCGICEHECPVRDYRAIRVTTVGETRSRDRSLLLK